MAGSPRAPGPLDRAPELPARAVLAAWQAAGTGQFEATVAALAPVGLTAPSGLPGWTRAHVVTHVARNADALVNLLTWARTGVETPMYADPADRDRDIAAGAARPAVEVVADLLAANARLAAAMAELAEPAWSTPVRTAQGRQVPAGLIPWMRAREVWMHAVDLAAGFTCADLPEALAAALLDDAVATVAARGPAAAHLVCEHTDDARRWELPGPGPAVLVRGSLGALVGFVLRGLRLPGLRLPPDAPAPPRWL